MSTKTKQIPLEQQSFDELVDQASRRIHSELLAGGGKFMKNEIHLWMAQAILWSRRQTDSKFRSKR